MGVNVSTPITVEAVRRWLHHLGYPTPQPGAPVLLYLEGAVPDFGAAAGGTLWPSPSGSGAQVWEGQTARDAIPVRAVPNRIDELNDTGLMVWVDERGGWHIGAFLGSVNPGSVLSGSAGWPQLGDGAHLYARSRRNDNGKPCFRSSRNRCLRERPTARAGGDGVLTLSEVAERGMYINPSILLHPGRKATYSAGCPLTPGTYADVAWKMVWGHAPAGLWILRHLGADALQWIRAGGPAHVPPALRPGANALRWVRPIQRALGLTADGIFGPQTAAALLAFRTQQGIDRATAERSAITFDDWRRLGLSAAAA